MRLSSPRWRVLLVCAAAVLLGRLVPELAGRVLLLWRAHLGGGCPAAAVSAEPSPGWWCALPAGPVTQARIVEAVLVLLGAGLLLVAVRWALGPLRDVAGVIRVVGPQNLGQRLTAGRFGGEAQVLARAVNEMLERVAVGYESQRRFAAAASHELRTPLAVQRALVEVSLANSPTPQKVEVVAEQLLAANERNVNLIEALLVLSESDRGLAGRTAVRLDHVVEKVLADHREQAAAAGVTITSRLSPRPVDGEELLLERLVTNLVQNAVKYNRPGGTIDVVVGDRPTLTVANTGDDVPVSAVARLFEPFQRLGGDRINRADGVGLGLTIVSSIVRAHGGTVTCHSTGHDGLRLEVDLPAGRG
ncbi:two-component sensor histidine kinase [Actinoplanes sp. NBRC 14428]|nr:two-component sensor histidine kinase [Actinoplanes sp. NBRC 14428]